MPQPTDGIVLIDKAEGESSYDVIRKVKTAIKTLDIRKVGHAGTLDPFATGLLIVLLGQGTKLSRFIMASSKHYLATMRLGIETDTLDYTGRVMTETCVPDLGWEFITKTAESLTGELEQTPPIYSAVKHNGERAYKLARKGLNVALKKRKISVYSIEILSVELPDVTLEVRCSQGTYIRTLAADFGKALGTGAHLRSLRRVACGPFNITAALHSRVIAAKNNGYDFLRNNLIPLNAALPDIPEISVGSAVSEKIRQGRQSALDGVTDGLDSAGYNGSHFKILENGELVAIVKQNRSRRDDHVRLEIERVFS